MNATYTSQDGQELPFYMGCYGIGVSRTVAAIYENSVVTDKSDKVNVFVLNENIAPYKFQIIPKMDNEDKVKQAEDIYVLLKQNGIDSILDDRESGTLGSKIKDCRVFGTPYMIVLGDKVEEGKLELENVKTGEKEIITIEELITKFVKK